VPGSWSPSIVARRRHEPRHRRTLINLNILAITEFWLTDAAARLIIGARAVDYHLLALRAGTEDPDLAALCDDLLRRFFPKRLSIVNWSYADEGGWAESMTDQMTSALHAKLMTIQVGDQPATDELPEPAIEGESDLDRSAN
jgi:hypothetical protein